MSNYLLLTVKSFYEDIVYSSLGREPSIARQKQTIRFNQFILLILVANFICVISYFIYGLYISALVNLSSAYLFIMAYQLNLRRHYLIGRMLSVVTLNVYLAVMNYMEGLRAAEYFYYWPYFLVITFIVSFKRSLLELAFAYLVTILSLYFCYTYCPQENHYQVHITGMFTKLHDSNLVISMVLTAFFSYAILRINRNNEAAILKEKQFVDTIYNTSLDGVFILDSEALIITDCNSRAVEMLEIGDKNDIVGASMDSLFTREHIKLFKDIRQNSDCDHKGWQGELSFTSKKDNTVFAYVNVVPFIDESNHFWKIS
ncbi:MAG TPA: PAS domain-containing protein, partial [Puia sp.]